jgi:hypothetical protein
VLAIGAINLAGAIAAIVTGMEGAFIGLVISSLIVVLGLLTPGTKGQHGSLPTVAASGESASRS